MIHYIHTGTLACTSTEGFVSEVELSLETRSPARLSGSLLLLLVHAESASRHMYLSSSRVSSWIRLSAVASAFLAVLCAAGLCSQGTALTFIPLLPLTSTCEGYGKEEGTHEAQAKARHHTHLPRGAHPTTTSG